MKKLHQKETKGSRFLIEPAEELDNIVGVAAILTPYYGLTLKHDRDTKWKGQRGTYQAFCHRSMSRPPTHAREWCCPSRYQG